MKISQKTKAVTAGTLSLVLLAACGENEQTTSPDMPYRTAAFEMLSESLPAGRSSECVIMAADILQKSSAQQIKQMFQMSGSTEGLIHTIILFKDHDGKTCTLNGSSAGFFAKYQ